MAYKWKVHWFWLEGAWEGACERCMVYKWMVHWFFECMTKHSTNKKVYKYSWHSVQTVHIQVRSPTFNILQATSIAVGYSLGDELLYKDVGKRQV